MQLVCASANPDKVAEIAALLEGSVDLRPRPAELPDVVEDADTLVGNARLKAVAVGAATGLAAVADDTGLFVDALDGAPGVYTADWAGPKRDFSIAMQKVHDELKSRQDWNGEPLTANFISVLCLAWPDGETQLFEGKVYGHVVWPPRGGNGFGYDPIFVADGQEQTFGEMEPASKYAISHRTRAFDHFKRAVLDAAG